MVMAQTHFDAGEYHSAAIQLTNLVQLQPRHAAGRFLLGRVYLRNGEVAAAVKELQQARNLGEHGDLLNLRLARALIINGRFDQAATELALYGNDHPSWLVLRGMLDLGQQRLLDAKLTFIGVLDVEPENQEARRGLMQAKLAAGNAALVRAELDRLLAVSADNTWLWIIKAQLDTYDGARG